MSKEASVAPRERVNIVYRPADGNGREEVELPMKMLVIGDFTGTPDDRSMEDREPIAIDKDNFDDVLKSQGIGLQLNVPDRLTGNPDDEFTVRLDIESLRDFCPEEIVKQVPELKRLLALRDALRSLKGPLENMPEFRKKIQGLITDDATRTKLLTEIGGAKDGEE